MDQSLDIPHSYRATLTYLLDFIAVLGRKENFTGIASDALASIFTSCVLLIHAVEEITDPEAYEKPRLIVHDLDLGVDLGFIGYLVAGFAGPLRFMLQGYVRENIYEVTNSRGCGKNDSCAIPFRVFFTFYVL